jgi:Matrixin
MRFRFAASALTIIMTILFATPSATAGPTCIPGMAPCPGAKWSPATYTYLVNINSFQTNLGLSLTVDDVRYWVPNTLSWWRERTGIQQGINFIYGTTTGTPDCNGTYNNSNQVYASPNCAPGDSAPCDIFGSTGVTCTSLPCTASSTIAEADICIWGDAVGPGNGCSGSWQIRPDSLFGLEDYDLLGVLAHEFGHALGLDHNGANSQMVSPTPLCGSTFWRHLYGDDIEGLAKVYPRSAPHDSRWREMTGSTWGAETTVGSIDGPWGVLAGVGRRGAGEAVIATELSDGGTIIGFNRATYPITAASTWTASNASVNTWRPPSVAGRPLSQSELWISAVALEQQTAHVCPGVRIYRSTDGFATRTSQNITTNICGTAHEPTVTYDRGTGKFVLFVVNREFSGGTPNEGNQLFYATYDGTTWTNPAATGIYTHDAVDIACSTSGSDCIMGFARGDSNVPRLRNRRFTVNSNGTITFGSSTDDAVNYTERSLGVGVRTVSSADQWLLGLPHTTDVSARSNGSHWFSTDTNATNPFPSFSWDNVGPLSIDRHRPAFAGTPGSNRVYLWYVW